MKHSSPTDATRETAALYSLGALPPDEAAAFEAHLREGCEVCRAEVRSFEAVARSLLHTAPAAAPRHDLKAELLQRIAHERETGVAKDSSGPTPQVWKDWQAAGLNPDWFTLRYNEGKWEGTGYDGVSVRRLFVDRARGSVTMLVRMDPGTSYPSHRHGGPEECYVLEGDLHVGEIVMRAGDYQRVEAESIHGVQWTESGCTLFIISSLDDEMVA